MLRSKNILWLIILCIVAFAFGCSDDDDNVIAPPEEEILPIEGRIGPDGDTLEIPGHVMFIVPPGALDDSINFTITPNDQPAPPSGNLCFVSTVFTIWPVGVNFNTPASLTLTYDESKLHGVLENLVAIHHFGGSTWDPQTSTVDEVDNNVTTSISHLSNYAAMVDTAQGVGVIAIYHRKCQNNDCNQKLLNRD